MARPSAAAGLLYLLLAAVHPVGAQTHDVLPAAADTSEASAPTRNGREIYERFREGLADKTCDADVSARWSKHFAAAPRRLAKDDDLLPMFGYVVDALHEASLPTEYALIPFVESGYRPGARSASGPAGLWQMIKLTARNHRIPISAGYDGRLSPVDSTRAAVRYLKTLHGMFAGDWRLAAMAYNAGEYRVLGALKRGGQQARNADPAKLALPGVTQAYVRKLHALSCLMTQAETRDEWLQALDRPVPRLQALDVPNGVDRLAAFARRTGQDESRLQRLNPVFTGGRILRPGAGAAQVLGVVGGGEPAVATLSQVAVDPPPVAVGEPGAGSPARVHTIVRGDTASAIATRYGVSVADLLRRNGLTARSLLRPGTTLAVDAPLD